MTPRRSSSKNRPGELTVDWGYRGPGAPQHWSSLSEDFATCSEGRQQSPVDITGYRRADQDPLVFSYSSDARTIRHDGKFVHVEYAPGNTLGIGHRVYHLDSVHVHTPSEHLVHGQGFAAELHLVHEDGNGNLAVVGQLFELGPPSTAIQQILDAAPKAHSAAGEGVTVNAGRFVPHRPGFYRYTGSKTTPPCDEPVQWYLLRRPRTLSAEQAKTLRSLSGGPNNRPVQPLGDRKVIYIP